MEMMRDHGRGQGIWLTAEKAVDPIRPSSRRCSSSEFLDVSVMWLIRETTDVLDNVLEASNVFIVFLPSTEDIDVRINSPAVVMPAMIYLTCLCCRMLGREGGSVDFGATLHNGVVDITIEPLPRPQYDSLPLQFDGVRSAMQTVGNRVYLNESEDRLYFTVSLPISRV